MRNDFGILILTHGRADEISTVSMLGKLGYTGKFFLVIDNEDGQATRYRERFGDEKVVMFDKRGVARWTDAGDNIDKRTAILWARNASFQIAEDLGLRYFMMLDDDYTNIRLRYTNRSRTVMIGKQLGMFEKAIDMCIEFLDSTGALSVAFAQGGDWIGGVGNRFMEMPVFRKCMNSFICRSDRRFKFAGRMNEDVTTYVRNAMNGKLMFSVMPITIEQKATQSVSGGMTEEYKDGGTYMKSFYTIMYAPSAVKISCLPGNANFRIHHRINWTYCKCEIIREKYKKY